MKLSLISRSLLITGSLLLSPPAANADQLPNNLNGWYQTEDGRRYFIEEKNGNVNLTRYNPQSGFPISAFQGNTNQQRTTISGTLKSCTVGHESYRTFTFRAKNTDSQRSLGFEDNGKWIQLYPAYPLKNTTTSKGPICASWLVQQLGVTSEAALYRVSNNPPTFLLYSKNNTDPSRTFSNYPIYKVVIDEALSFNPNIKYWACRDTYQPNPGSRQTFDQLNGPRHRGIARSHFRSYEGTPSGNLRSIFGTERPTVTRLRQSNSGALIPASESMFPDSFYSGATNKPRVTLCRR